MNDLQTKQQQAGFSLIEVLITMVIILVALLGIVALQAQAHIAELEAHERAQALIFLSDISDRMVANHETASCFAITTNTTAGTPFIGATGSGHLTSPTCTVSTAAYNTQAVDTINDLDSELQGANETLSDGTKAGAMIGARACISYDSSTEVSGQPGTGVYTIIVTWQGMSKIAAPLNQDCAVGLYGDPAQRRAVSTTLRLAKLL